MCDCTTCHPQVGELPSLQFQRSYKVDYNRFEKVYFAGNEPTVATLSAQQLLDGIIWTDFIN